MAHLRALAGAARIRMWNYNSEGAGVNDCAERADHILGGCTDRRADAHLGDENGCQDSPQSVQRNG
jgi:hypothetical protein